MEKQSTEKGHYDDQKRTDDKHQYSRENRVYKGGRWGTVNAGPATDKTEEEPAHGYEYAHANRVYKGGRWGTVNAGPVKYDIDQDQPTL